MYINIKSKYKKIFWLLIGFCLACVFVDKVHAYTLPSGYEITTESIQNLWDTYIKDKTVQQIQPSCNPNYGYPGCTNKFSDSEVPFNMVMVGYNSNQIVISFARSYDDVVVQTSGNLTGFGFTPDRPGQPLNQYDFYYYPQIFLRQDGTFNYVTGYRANTKVWFSTSSAINSYVGTGDYIHFAINFNLLQNDNIIKESNFVYPSSGPSYLNGYKKVTIPIDTQYTMISSSQITSGYVFISLDDFNNYGGRLSYFDKDLSSQPYTSYIQDYTITSDGLYARQYFDLSSYNGADWVMFSKYIYLEGQDDFTYDIWIPNESYSSLVTVTSNNSGGNDFDFSYVDENGELQADIISSVDLTPPQPLLGDIFQNFTTNDFGLSSIITAPLPLIQSLNSATCTELSLPLGMFGGGVHDNNLILPCMTPLYQNWFGQFFNLYQTITTGFIAYYVGLGFFNKIKQLKDPENDIIEVVDL